MKKNESSQRGRYSQAHSHVHKVQLSCHAPEAKAAFLAGTFNDWNSNTTPMIALGEGQWAKELMSAPDR